MIYSSCAIIYKSQNMESTEVPINSQVNKKVVIHIYNEILLGHKKALNLTICDSVDMPKKYYSIDLLIFLLKCLMCISLTSPRQNSQDLHNLSSPCFLTMSIHSTIPSYLSRLFRNPFFPLLPHDRDL